MCGGFLGNGHECEFGRSIVPSINQAHNTMKSVSSELLTRYDNLAKKAAKLERGCSCEYDYRCYSCDIISDVVTMEEELL